MKARFPGGISEGFHPAVVQVAATVEDHLLDALGDGAFGEEFADGCGGVAAATIDLEAGAQFFVNGSCRTERALGIVIDDLGVDVIVGAEYGQSRAIRGAVDVATQAPVALLRLLFAGQFGHGVGEGEKRQDKAYFLPDLPALRRMRSPSYLMPLPL